MEIQCLDCANYLANDNQLTKNQRKIKWVVSFSVLMMVGEVFLGYSTGSMALVAEGWHMGSHVGALSIALIAYHLAKSPRLDRRLSFGAGKLIPLGGYTSAIILGIVALFVFIESVGRLFVPVNIQFNEAIFVAAAGLSVNVISALLLHTGHDHAHGPDCRHHVHDHNIRSAFLHVLADAVTSVLALVALTLGKIYHWNFLDPVIGVVGAVVILSWAFQLCRDTGWELLDGHSKTVDWNKLRALVEVPGTKILDFHIWRIAPKAVACELVVSTTHPQGPKHYHKLLRDNFSVQHIVVEEHLLPD